MSCPADCRCPNCDATMAAVARMDTEEYAEWLRETQAIALRGATARLTATGGTPGGDLPGSVQIAHALQRAYPGVPLSVAAQLAVATVDGARPYGATSRRTPDYQHGGAEPPKPYDIALRERRAKGGQP